MAVAEDKCSQLALQILAIAMVFILVERLVKNEGFFWREEWRDLIHGK